MLTKNAKNVKESQERRRYAEDISRAWKEMGILIMIQIALKKNTPHSILKQAGRINESSGARQRNCRNSDI